MTDLETIQKLESELNVSLAGRFTLFKDHSNVRTLDLSYLNLDKLPITVCELDQLQKLDLEHNELSFLPKQLSKL